MLVEFLTVIQDNTHSNLGVSGREEIAEVVIDLMDVVSFHRSYAKLNGEQLNAVKIFTDYGSTLEEYNFLMEYKDFKSVYDYYLASKGAKNVNEIVRAKDFVNKEWKE